MSWQPIYVFSDSAVDQVLIASDLAGAVREMREQVGADLRREGRSAAIVDRMLDVAEKKLRDTWRAQAELTVASAKARLLRGEENGHPS